MMYPQLSFDFDETAYPRFDKLLGNANAELIYILQQEHDQFLYLWGEQGSGKSHILQAWVGQAAHAGHSALYIDVGKTPLHDTAAEYDFVAIDQVERLNDQEQAVLFDIFNHFRNSQKGHLLLSADVPPGRLHLREDLRTRMSYCLVYEVKSLSSEEKIQALANMAQARQLSIDADIYRYLLEHWRQDLNSLLTMFNDLANYSITQGKPITLPLLRKLLKQQENA